MYSELREPEVLRRVNLELISLTTDGVSLIVCSTSIVINYLRLQNVEVRSISSIINLCICRIQVIVNFPRRTVDILTMTVLSRSYVETATISDFTFFDIVIKSTCLLEGIEVLNGHICSV